VGRREFVATRFRCVQCAAGLARKRGSAAGLVVLLLTVSACAANPTAAVTLTGPSATDTATLLASSNVPTLVATTRYVSATDIAKDAAIPGFGAAVVAMGFEKGVQRSFQGPSKHLTLAVSRTLTFATPAGATEFVAYVRRNAVSYFGFGANTVALVSRGRRGWLYEPPSCACHMANPDVVGVVSIGRAVVSLEINGPDATAALLRSLLAPVGPSQ
jgi:hypothetical protein